MEKSQQRCHADQPVCNALRYTKRARQQIFYQLQIEGVTDQDNTAQKY